MRQEMPGQGHTQDELSLVGRRIVRADQLAEDTACEADAHVSGTATADRKTRGGQVVIGKNLLSGLHIIEAQLARSVLDPCQELADAAGERPEPMPVARPWMTRLRSVL